MDRATEAEIKRIQEEKRKQEEYKRMLKEVPSPQQPCTPATHYYASSTTAFVTPTRRIAGRQAGARSAQTSQAVGTTRGEQGSFVKLSKLPVAGCTLELSHEWGVVFAGAGTSASYARRLRSKLPSRQSRR